MKEEQETLDWREIAEEKIIESIEPLDLDYWVKGSVGHYRFQAKVYPKGSKYGIEGGRVSKLSISRIDPIDGIGKVIVADYDRGWNERPHAGRDKEMYELILACLESMPDDWKNM